MENKKKFNIVLKIAGLIILIFFFIWFNYKLNDGERLITSKVYLSIHVEALIFVAILFLINKSATKKEIPDYLKKFLKCINVVLSLLFILIGLYTYLIYACLFQIKTVDRIKSEDKTYKIVLQNKGISLVDTHGYVVLYKKSKKISEAEFYIPSTKRMSPEDWHIEWYENMVKVILYIPEDESKSGYYEIEMYYDGTTQRNIISQQL